MLGLSRSKQKHLGRVEITISNHTVVRVLALVILSFMFLAVLKKATHPLILIFTAFFLSLVLNAPVHWLAQRLPGKRRGNRTLATGISFFIIISLLLGFIASWVPPLVRQTSNFIDAVPGLVENLRDENSGIGRFVRRYNLEDQVDKFSGQLGDRLKDISGTAVPTLTRISSSIFSVLTILVLTFMMLIEGPRWIAFAKRLIPPQRLPHVEQIVSDMYAVVKGFANGQVLLAALAALFILVPLLILKVSYPVALMVVVFICGLIPLVGHTLGAVIVSTFALFNSPVVALIILIYYITYQQIENYVIQPKVQANSTNMTPLLVFSSVIVGVSFGGLLGGLVAIPVAGCLRIALVDYLQSRKLLEDVHIAD